MLPSPELLKYLAFAFLSFHLRTGKGSFSSEYQAIHKVQKLSVYTVQILTMINNETPEDCITPSHNIPKDRVFLRL